MSHAYISKALRTKVTERANDTCEYCQLHSKFCMIPHQIDHIIATQHGGPTIISNLALACYDCNRFKGPNIASFDHDKEEVVRLFNPRVDIWEDHFYFEKFHIASHTSIGDVTLKLLKMNRDAQVLRRTEADWFNI